MTLLGLQGLVLKAQPRLGHGKSGRHWPQRSHVMVMALPGSSCFFQLAGEVMKLLCSLGQALVHTPSYTRPLPVLLQHRQPALIWICWWVRRCAPCAHWASADPRWTNWHHSPLHHLVMLLLLLKHHLLLRLARADVMRVYNAGILACCN